MEYKFGFADIEHAKIDEVIAMLDEYKIEKYIVAMETVTSDSHVATNGEHMHFVLHVEPKVFKNWYYTLKNRYNLAGKNGKTGRYIGFLCSKKVKDPERLMAYTTKDNSLIWKGFHEDEIKQLFEQSFQKDETVFQAVMKHLLANRFEYIDGHDIDVTRIEVEILRYHMQLGVKLCKSKLKNYALAYMQLHMDNRYDYLDHIYHYTMNH